MNSKQVLLLQGMAQPGFKLVMQELRKYADNQTEKYDDINVLTDPGAMMRVQITRDVILNGIPGILEEIMNKDKPAPKWSFMEWLRGFLCVCLILVASSASANKGLLELDGNRIPVQGAAPNGLYSAIMTVASTTISVVDDAWWGIYAPTTGCKFRLLPTSAKGSYPAFTVPDGQVFGFVVNKATPFLNLSGCTLAERYRQHP